MICCTEGKLVFFYLKKYFWFIHSIFYDEFIEFVVASKQQKTRLISGPNTTWSGLNPLKLVLCVRIIVHFRSGEQANSDSPLYDIFCLGYMMCIWHPALTVVGEVRLVRRGWMGLEQRSYDLTNDSKTTTLWPTFVALTTKCVRTYH